MNIYVPPPTSKSLWLRALLSMIGRIHQGFSSRGLIVALKGNVMLWKTQLRFLIFLPPPNIVQTVTLPVNLF